MNSGRRFLVTKPVSFWNKPINADFKELFKALGKAAADSAFRNWNNVALDVVDASAALGLSTEPEEVAWLLIYRSLTQGMSSLLEGNKELLVNKPENLETLGDCVAQSLENEQVTIDQDFFQRPKDLPIVAALKTHFAQWLESFVKTKAEAHTISDRLPAYFVFALHDEWAKRPDQYACLQNPDTPFTSAWEREQAWLRCSAWLQKQVEEPMFLEAFSLQQVYVPPRAYYKRKVEGQKDEEFERRIAADKKDERIVVDLTSELEAWLSKTDRHDAIRVISGGPGSGKSSFAKIFAANQAEKGKMPVLFIPLHHFDPSEDLIDAVGEFVRLDGFLSHNPLETDNGESQLLIIFDGLDELAMQGKIAAEVAQQFVREVQKKVDWFNQRETRVQVLKGACHILERKIRADY
jgi:hypothetical protein